VEAFAEAIEERLQANDHKGGWVSCPPAYLLKRLRQEVKELAAVCTHRRYSRAPKEQVIHEAADVAAFAMMLADNVGGLMMTGSRSRAETGARSHGRNYGGSNDPTLHP
jgi:NTP pyrophosphatase (non-canonical NTP hydrolase)